MADSRRVEEERRQHLLLVGEKSYEHSDGRNQQNRIASPSFLGLGFEQDPLGVIERRDELTHGLDLEISRGLPRCLSRSPQRRREVRHLKQSGDLKIAQRCRSIRDKTIEGFHSALGLCKVSEQKGVVRNESRNPLREGLERVHKLPRGFAIGTADRFEGSHVSVGLAHLRSEALSHALEHLRCLSTCEDLVHDRSTHETTESLV